MFLLFSFFLHSARSELYSNGNCQYAFNVWQPNADELQRMRILEVQYANFTNYVDKELLKYQLQRSNDLEIYRNWTIMYDRSLMDLKTEQLQKYVELQELRVKVGIYEIKLEEMKETYENSLYRMSNHRSGRKKHVRKDRMLPTYGSQSDTPKEQLIENLKNMVSDLKAEWILLKREFIDMRGDNKNLHKMQTALYNSSVTCQTENSQMKDKNELLENRGNRMRNDIDSIKAKVDLLTQDLSTIKAAQLSVKSDILATENGLSALQAATADIRRTVTGLQNQATGQKPIVHSSQVNVDFKTPVREETGTSLNKMPDKIPRGK